MSIRRYFIIGIVSVSFFIGVPAVSAQAVSAEALAAQINSLLLLFQDLQAQLASLRAEKIVAQPLVASSTSVTVLSPNSGESFTPGQSVRVSWSGGDKKVQVGLVDKRYETDRTVLGWISLNEKPNSSFVWNGEKVSDITGTVSQTVASLSGGPYKIISVSAGLTENYCVSPNSNCNYDVSDSYFTVVSPVSSNALLVSCTPSVAAGEAGAVITWEATASNGQPPYAYSWSGTDTISILPPRFSSEGKFLDVIYHAPGLKTAGVTVRDATGKSAFAPCGFEVTVAPAPSPLTLLSPNGGESFVLTQTADPSQFVKVSWRLKGLPQVKEEKVLVSLQDMYGRECALSSVSRRLSETFLGLVDGYRCPNNNWALSPGQYKIKVSVEGRDTTVFDISDSSFTLTAPVSDVQLLIPSPSVINSGESVKFRFFSPPNAINASLYSFCPNGITAQPPHICNKYIDVTSYMASSTEYTATFFNVSSQARDVASNFYVYLPNNPNYARGVPARVTVRPVSAASNNSITVLSPNGGEKVYYGASSVYRFQSNQAGLVDLTLVPYPPIDAGLVCQIATGVSASLGEFSLAIRETSSCLNGPSKIAAGSYKLFATLRDGETKLATDLSDSPFTVAATSTASQ